MKKRDAFAATTRRKRTRKCAKDLCGLSRRVGLSLKLHLIRRRCDADFGPSLLRKFDRAFELTELGDQGLHDVVLENQLRLVEHSDVTVLHPNAAAWAARSQ